jgi:prephenate dehydrogenase
MAGREVGGLERADEALFEERAWVFTPVPGPEPPPGFDDLRSAVRAIGAHELIRTPEDHDREVALVTHLPFLAAAAYLRGAAQGGDWEGARQLASSGFADFTRVGAGDPEMYAAILEQNSEQVLASLAGLRRALDQMEELVKAGASEPLRDAFAGARDTRREWEAGRG